LCLLVVAITAGAADIASVVPHSYPRSYANLLDAARAEKKLRIYAAADTFDTVAVLKDFSILHPEIKVESIKLHTADLYQRFLEEVNSGRETADMLISSAMDLQIKLVNDGYAQPYASPEKPRLPAWAVWKNEAYGVSAEPIVIVYNKRLLAPQDIPQSHYGLTSLLHAKEKLFYGKVATYDPARSAAGFLYLTQDAQISRDTDELIRAIGRTAPNLSTSGAEILQGISSGRFLLAYNMNGAYALERQASDPAIGVVFPRDYTLVMARIAFITREARHPAAAKVFLDYLLSVRGQKLLAGLRMTPVRDDVHQTGPHPDAEWQQALQVR
jgi:iron(III) transport system substrate-binding protein